MNQQNKIPLRETLFLTVGEIITGAVIIAVYLLIGKFDYTVITGAVLGGAVTVLNFLFLAISVNRAIDRILAQREFTPTPIPEASAESAQKADCEQAASEVNSEDADSDSEDEDGGEADDEAAKFAREHQKRLQAAIKLSYVIRTFTMIAALLVALFTKQFNLIATVIPLFMLRPLLMISEMTKRKEK